MDNKYLIIAVAIIVGGLLIGGGLAYDQFAQCSSEDQEEVLSEEEVSDKALNYINRNLLRGMAEASVEEVLSENGLYKIDIDVQGQKISTYATKDGALFFPEGIKLSETALAAVSKGTTVGNFNVSDEEICMEDEKPAVYFFGSDSCPHCSWEHPIVKEVAEKFGDKISFNDNMGNQEDMDVFQKFSTGGVPALVLGCRYYRVGSGEQKGEELEKDNLTALLCKLTGEEPSDVCSEVEDIIKEIN